MKPDWKPVRPDLPAWQLAIVQRLVAGERLLIQKGRRHGWATAMAWAKADAEYHDTHTPTAKHDT